MAEDITKNQGRHKLLVTAVAVAAALAAIISALNWQGDAPGTATATKTQSTSGAVSLSRALVTGQMKNFVLKKDQPAMPGLKFVNADAKPLTLEDWKGRIVLLNLWATWCAPCRHEMPSLNRLEEALGGENFEVVALSVDRKGLKASAKFLQEVNASALKLYSDKTSEALQQLQVIGLPATILIDRQGREIGRLLGPAEWDAPEAKALIEAALKAG
ncbi:MAG: TlpA disulfide reductase family protein [Pseudomonadota bacterium]